MAAKHKSKSPKVTALLAEGTFNPAAEKVRDPKFREHDFFDPRDLVQVKYEMLRRVSLDHASVTAATAEYGVSRPTYYQAKAYFATAGIAGLVPHKRESTNASARDGPPHSSVEVPVTGRERRGWVIQLRTLTNQRWEESMASTKPFSIAKQVVWDAYRQVKANHG